MKYRKMTTADLDTFDGYVRKAMAGVDTMPANEYQTAVATVIVNALNVSKMARQVATIRDATLEEAAKYHDNLMQYQMRQADDAKTDSSRARWLQSATINQSHAENLRVMKTKPQHDRPSAEPGGRDAAPEGDEDRIARGNYG